MASTSASMEIDVELPHEVDGQFIRVIVADTQAIFRAGLRKIFALEDDIRVVGQSETLSQTLSAAKKFTADILIFEAALSPNPVEAVSELIRQTPGLRLVVVKPRRLRPVEQPLPDHQELEPGDRPTLGERGEDAHRPRVPARLLGRRPVDPLVVAGEEHEQGGREAPQDRNPA